MKNWSVDEAQLKKHPQKYKLWKIEQLINWGLDKDDKILSKDLEKYWPQIKDKLDPYKKRYLEFLLWRKVFSLPDNLIFWDLSVRQRK